MPWARAQPSYITIDKNGRLVVSGTAEVDNLDSYPTIETYFARQACLYR